MANLVLVLLVYGLTYRLGERLISALAGVLAVLGVASSIFCEWNVTQMYSGIMMAFLVALSTLVLVALLEKPRVSRLGAAALGLVLGVTALGGAAGLVFIPVAAGAVAIRARHEPARAVVNAGLVLLVAAATVSPWTIRNYAVFGEFVPVRNGFGQIAFIGTVGVGAAAAPETIRSEVKPSWRAASPRTAITRLATAPFTEEADLQRFQLEYAREVWADWETLNEAQRDKRFTGDARAYIAAHPGIAVQLAVAKAEVFARMTDRAGTLLFLLAALGALLSLTTPAVLTVTVLAGAYLSPFLVAIAYYARYRAPVEPLLAVLAAFACSQVLIRLSPGLHRALHRDASVEQQARSAMARAGFSK